MEENIVVLLDIYGGLLAKSQREALDLRYNSDLSLAEIAEEMGGISRQSVNDFLKKGRARLLEIEQLLGNASAYRAILSAVDEAQGVLKELQSDYKDERLDLLENTLTKIKKEINN